VGCSNTIALHKPVTLADAQQVTKATANQAVKVQVVLLDRPGAEPEVREGILAVDDGGAFVLSSPPEEPRRIPFELTRKVVLKNRRMGALEGFLVGAIPGALVGFLLGSALDQSGCNEDGSGMRSVCSSSAALKLGLGGAVLSGVVGAVVGAAVGQRTTFTF
jgi:uncharacterized membrane protein YeaQ/YmgE (transglycosylase-associated protein family)